MLAQGSFSYLFAGYLQVATAPHNIFKIYISRLFHRPHCPPSPQNDPAANLSSSLDQGVPIAILLASSIALPLSLCGCLHAKPLVHVEV